jgi:hypothetical protein
MNKIVFAFIGLTFLFFQKPVFGQTNIIIPTNRVTYPVLEFSTNGDVVTNYAKTATNFVKKSGAEIDKEFNELTAPQPRGTNLMHLFGQDKQEELQKKLEEDRSLAESDCDHAKNEYDTYMSTLGLNQDVTLRLESSVDTDEYVNVDIYVTYNSFDFMSRKDLQEQTKNKVGALLLKYLTIHFPRSHISARPHENNLNSNWDK